jgi:hypothetical protein
MASYRAGLDLGKQNDFSALVIVERRGWLRPKHLVRFARRWRGTAYTLVVEQVAEILSRPPLTGADLALNFDSTGVGSAVQDILVDAYDQGRLPVFPQGIVLTGGEPMLEIPFARAGVRRIPKQDVLAPLEIALAEGRLQFAAGLTLAGPLKEELLNFKASHTASGHAKFEAGGSGHDDLVIALALGLFTGGDTSAAETNWGLGMWACPGCGEIFAWSAGRACPVCKVPAADTYTGPQGGDDEVATTESSTAAVTVPEALLEPAPAPRASTEPQASSGGWTLTSPFPAEGKPRPAQPSPPGPFVDVGWDGQTMRGLRVTELLDPVSGRWACRSCGREWSSATSRCDDCLQGAH